jgi:hypothetical protein
MRATSQFNDCEGPNLCYPARGLGTRAEYLAHCAAWVLAALTVVAALAAALGVGLVSEGTVGQAVMVALLSENCLVFSISYIFRCSFFTPSCEVAWGHLLTIGPARKEVCLDQNFEHYGKSHGGNLRLPAVVGRAAAAPLVRLAELLTKLVIRS